MEDKECLVQFMSWLVSAWQCLGVAENLLHLPLATLIVVLSANKISYRKCLNILRLGYRIGFQRGLRLRNAEGLAPQVGFEPTSFRITAERSAHSSYSAIPRADKRAETAPLIGEEHSTD